LECIFLKWYILKMVYSLFIYSIPRPVQKLKVGLGLSGNCIFLKMYILKMYILKMYILKKHILKNVYSLFIYSIPRPDQKLKVGLGLSGNKKLYS